MQNPSQYAGDVSVTEAFEKLQEDQNSILVDVRTQAEWTFVGIPDLRAVGKEPVFAEWQSFPPASPVTDFAEKLSALLSEKGLDQSASIFFLCRSGARSQAAAIAMTQLGYSSCFNVAAGFEGGLDAQGHRGTQSGWKASGLPWIQN
ncbi:rhodanese-like domain-containing protein [Roseibium sp. RKSG952]|uniref:rhodanese-like domain-containing protein n=1 Tax=Roseibium sp. RKSG952 TaxID=2529384 RepID=UPI0013C8069A|nr:rhodanese-like domain-containing protein [Roseibium sp. RKSG952]